MKRVNWILAVAVMSGLVLAGCSKTATLPKTQKVNGVDVAMPELSQSLVDSKDKGVQKCLQELAFDLRYGDLPKAQTTLETLVNNASLTDAQKKLASQVADQVKQAASQPPPQPGK